MASRPASKSARILLLAPVLRSLGLPPATQPRSGTSLREALKKRHTDFYLREEPFAVQAAPT